MLTGTIISEYSAFRVAVQIFLIRGITLAASSTDSPPIAADCLVGLDDDVVALTF